MKKITTFLGAALFASLILSSCGTDAKDIKLSDLDTACDYVEAMIICAEEMTEIKGDHDNRSDLSKDEQEEYKEISQKMRDVSQACRKKFTKAEVKECDDYDELDKLMDEL
jgi:Spy/CpxP family protein refolding chaperone